MHDGIAVLLKEDTTYIDKLLLDDTGILRPVPMEIIAAIPHNRLQLWAHKHAVYQFVTIEMIEWLKNELDGFSAIEICAGYGTIARALGIPATDVKAQEELAVIEHYNACNQPVIKYPADVVKMEALEAVKYYKPGVAIGAFVTQYGTFTTHAKGIPCSPFGPKETQLLKLVKKYIVFGNKVTHAKKHIFAKPHQELKFNWIFSRAIDPTLNRVWVFENK